MIRLLIIGSGSPGSLEGAYQRSFKRLGECQADFFDVNTRRLSIEAFGLGSRVAARVAAPISRIRIQQRCEQFLTARRGAYDAILVFKGADFSRASLEHYRDYQPTAVWLNLNPDDPFNVSSRGSTNGNILSSLSFFDIYLIWSRELVRKLKLSGCRRTEYLPFGYDPDFHRPPHLSGQTNSRSVSFIGAWDKQREETLEGISDFDLVIFGNNWKRARRHSPLASKIVSRDIYGRELADVVYTSNACLNLLRSQNSGAHNMRTFEIPAMGGLMITTRSAEQNEYFPDGDASLMFENIEELREQLGRVRREPAMAEKIRSRSQSLVQNHSYVERANQIVQLIRSA